MKIVLGYDLNNEVSQLSYMTEGDAAPVTVATTMGSACYEIPTVLAKKHGVNQWFYGEEAIRLSKTNEAQLVENIMQKAINQEQIVLEEEEFSAISLLSLFLKRTLAIVNLIVPWQLADEIVFTVDEIDFSSIAIYNEVIHALPVDKEKIHIQSHTESFYHYTIHQPMELWKYDVMALEYKDTCIHSMELMINRKLKPMVCLIEQNEFENEKGQNDERLHQIVEELIHGKIISSVFLIGSGFDGGWAKETLKLLCSNRRVFQGKNMYTKGACYAAYDRVVKNELNDSYLFLGRDKLKCNIGLKLMLQGEEQYESLVDAGINWYDVDVQYEFLIGREKEIRFLLTPMTGKNVRNAVVRLSGIPDRPERSSRVRVRLTMKSEEVLLVKVYDQGFGEIFPTTDQVWEEEIPLYKE